AGTSVTTAALSSTTVDPDAANNSSTVQVQVLTRPAISNLSYDGTAGTFTLSIPTGNGIAYRVDYKNELTDPTWTVLTTFTGDGNVKPIADPGPLPPTRFYRVVAP
ncbi:MAG TPA: hypothetical protein VK850_04280, partial [Candidatus Binatia bacterium]|nr:hypothetical protein [Candidatus Binatia bacterium]